VLSLTDRVDIADLAPAGPQRAEQYRGCSFV